MHKNQYSAIGLMSGTSLDGLDIAYVHFRFEDEAWEFELINAISLDYEKAMRQKLKDTINMSALDLLTFNVEYGQWLGQQVHDFVATKNVKVDFVASHGHTVFHQTDKRLTYQIGDGQELANASGLMVVNDFRSLDVSLGGQGAPLVPIGDALLFKQYDYCLNLGGIANISFEQDGKRQAFDITVANMLLNHLVGKIGKDYDDNGDLARSGSKDESLFDQLNKLEYCLKPFPKSTGYEWFLEQVLPIVENSPASIVDKLCTTVHHLAYQINKQIPNQEVKTSKRMLSTGGGTKNRFLFETIQAYLDNNIELVNPGNAVIDFKESIVFALMGVLKLRSTTNCLASVTGASSDNSGGYMYYPLGINI